MGPGGPARWLKSPNPTWIHDREKGAPKQLAAPIGRKKVVKNEQSKPPTAVHQVVTMGQSPSCATSHQSAHKLYAALLSCQPCSTVMAVPFDVKTHEVHGPRIPVLEALCEQPLRRQLTLLFQTTDNSVGRHLIYSGEYIVANALHYCQRTTASWNCLFDVQRTRTEWVWRLTYEIGL